MQILCGSLQIPVPEQDLDGAQIGACLQQMGRPTVAQRVRVTRLRMPARRAASLHAIQTVLSEIG